MGTEKGLSMENELSTLKITGDATKLFEELAKAQADFLPVPKTSVGQIGKDRKFKYAGYAVLMRCVRPALVKHGIAILQPLHFSDDQAITTTILAGHGAVVQSSFAFTADENPQEFGRHHTYYRRYQLQSLLGLEGDADADDLPDVNVERDQSQFSEPAKETKQASAPKGKASAETKSAPVESTQGPSVSPSEPSTNGKSAKSEPKAEPKVEPKSTTTDVALTTKTINEVLTSAMKELKWGMDELRAFFKEHVDEKGIEKVNNLTLAQKQSLFSKLVEIKNVTPF